jgi:hypothetical protein
MKYDHTTENNNLYRLKQQINYNVRTNKHEICMDE